MTDELEPFQSEAEAQTPAVFHRTWLPHAALRSYVTGVSGYLEYEAGVADQEQTPTVGIVPMIFVLQAGWDYQVNEKRESLGRSFVAGIRSSPVTMISNDFAICLQVDFTPRGARRFLGIDMQEISECIYPLDDVLGRFCNLLEEKLAGTNSWDDKFKLLEGLLIERLVGEEKKRQINSTTVAAALLTIEKQPLNLSVNGLAQEIGVSRKHLAKLFSREIGVTPSRYLQLKQFEEALDMMRSGKAAKLIDVAYHCGFSDQAHFSRQFRRFTNRSPIEYLAALRLPQER